MSSSSTVMPQTGSRSTIPDDAVGAKTRDELGVLTRVLMLTASGTVEDKVAGQEQDVGPLGGPPALILSAIASA